MQRYSGAISPKYSGELVKFEDAASEINELKNEINSLKKELRDRKLKFQNHISGLQNVIVNLEATVKRPKEKHDLQRYELDRIDMFLADRGKWVKFEDIEAVIVDFRDEIEEINRNLRKRFLGY